MKLFTTDDILAIERQTLSAETITSVTLIERYAEGAAAEIVSRWRPSKRIIIFAGPGKNGSYAIATGQLLKERGYNPSIYLFNIGGHCIESECKSIRDKFRSTFRDADFNEITTTFNTPDLGRNDLVVDGLFGSDLREPLIGGFVAVVRFINESGSTVVSLDLPSGLFGDWNNPAAQRNIIHAHLTLSVQFPRIAFFMPENAELVGEWKVVDINLNQEAIDQRKTHFHLVEEDEIRNLLKPRNPFCNKSDFGSACIVAGRFGMAGAAVLSAKASQRAGVGKTIVHAPQCCYQILQTSVPEAIFDSDENKMMLSNLHTDITYDAWAIGPGIGTSDITVNAVDTFLKKIRKPIVIDADGLNCISRRPDLINHIPLLSVLTPHDGEFDRLFGQQDSHQARLIKAVEAARHHNFLILLKGRYSALCRPDGKVYFNSSGSPALATAGSGDVLTGVIAALIAQGYKPEVASIIGTYIHGKAGEIAAKQYGEYGTTAFDIAEAIASAIKSVLGS